MGSIASRLASGLEAAEGGLRADGGAHGRSVLACCLVRFARTPLPKAGLSDLANLVVTAAVCVMRDLGMANSESDRDEARHAGLVRRGGRPGTQAVTTMDTDSSLTGVLQDYGYREVERPYFRHCVRELDGDLPAPTLPWVPREFYHATLDRPSGWACWTRRCEPSVAGFQADHAADDQEQEGDLQG